MFSTPFGVTTQSFYSVMQKVLGEFVTVEMAFHAKALEVYTMAYQHVQNVDEEGDLEVRGLLCTQSGRRGMEGITVCPVFSHLLDHSTPTHLGNGSWH